MKDELIKFLEKELSKELDYEKLLETPKLSEHGDLSLPMFILSKELKKNPVEIAKEYESKLNLKKVKSISEFKAIGPYLNIYFNQTNAIKKIFNNFSKKNHLKYKIDKPQKILIEWPSPNTNKSLHIGHVRNILIGKSLSNILERTGNKVIKTNLNNDRGISICKAMLAYKLFGNNKTPKDENIKPDKFVENFYVLFGEKVKENPKLEEEALDMLKKWEASDKGTIELWNRILSWVYEGFDETYKKFDLKHDKTYYESQIYDQGKDIVLESLKNNVEGFAKEDDGAIYCDFENEVYGKKYLLRSNGTTMYITQDIYLADLKRKDFNADKYIFVVGKEQKYHFDVLFELLIRMKIFTENSSYHFAYGYVYDKNGEKFSSRKGRVIRADELISEIENKAIENIKSKELTKNLKEKEVLKRAQIIAYGALAFSMLKVNPISDINFDIEAAISFEGETGPYVQYTYARINKLIQKAGNINTENKIDYSIYTKNEYELIKLLNNYSNIIQEAQEKYKISAIAQYLIKVCQAYNEIYQNYPIIKSEENVKMARLELSRQVQIVIKDGLELLGIKVLKEM